MAKRKLADIPDHVRRGQKTTAFYAQLWEEVRLASKLKKAVVVNVPPEEEVAGFANKVRQNATHRIGKGRVGVLRLESKRQLLVWMK